MVDMRVQNVVQARQVEEYKRSRIETMVLPSLRAGSLVGRVSLAKELARGMGRGKVSLHASY